MIINQIKNIYIDFKCLSKKNKIFFIVSLVALGIGLFLAVTNKYAKPDDCGCMACMIKAGSFNPFFYLIKVFFCIALMYFIIFLGGYHFVFYLLNFVFITVFLFLQIKFAITAILFNTLCGFLYLTLFLLPIIFINYIMFDICVLKIYDLSGYCANKKYFVSYSCLYKVLFKHLSAYIIVSLIISFLIFLINFILLSLIF